MVRLVLPLVDPERSGRGLDNVGWTIPMRGDNCLTSPVHDHVPINQASLATVADQGLDSVIGFWVVGDKVLGNQLVINLANREIVAQGAVALQDIVDLFDRDLPLIFMATGIIKPWSI